MKKKLDCWGMAVLICLWAVPAAAWSADLAGKWKVNHVKTEMKDFPDLIVEISIREDGVEFKKTQPDPKGDIVHHMVLPPDGKEGTYKGLRGKVLKCSGRIENGTLTVDFEQIAFRQGKPVILQVHEVYVLSADGATLSMTHQDVLSGRTTAWPRPVIFDRVNQ